MENEQNEQEKPEPLTGEALAEQIGGLLKHFRRVSINMKSDQQKEEDEKVYFLETRREFYPLSVLSSFSKR
jgi:hypothetical protein